MEKKCLRVKPISNDAELRAYIVGIAIGDGNLSNPNKKAVRLRISCDTQYPHLILKISRALSCLLPKNKISLVTTNKPRCVNISCYSNYFEKLLGWEALSGSKYRQNVTIPKWVKLHTTLITKCLCGLFETDGSIYYDRGYKMINFVTIIEILANDVMEAMIRLNFKPHLYKIHQTSPQRTRYNIRLSKDVDKFIFLLGINKT